MSTNAELRAQVEALRERVRIEKINQATAVAGQTDEYRNAMLEQERDRLKAELAAVLGVEVGQVEVPEGAVLTEEVAGTSDVVPEGVNLATAGAASTGGLENPDAPVATTKSGKVKIDPNVVVVTTNPTDPAAPGDLT